MNARIFTPTKSINRDYFELGYHPEPTGLDGVYGYTNTGISYIMPLLHKILYGESTTGNSDRIWRVTRLLGVIVWKISGDDPDNTQPPASLIEKLNELIELKIIKTNEFKTKVKGFGDKDEVVSNFQKYHWWRPDYYYLQRNGSSPFDYPPDEMLPYYNRYIEITHINLEKLQQIAQEFNDKQETKAPPNNDADGQGRRPQ